MNDTPTITSTSVTSSTEDSAYSYTFGASDVDSGDNVTYAATTLPSWLTFDADTGVLSGTPTNSEVGTHSVVLTATDASGAVDTQSFTITVSDVNDAPTVTSTALTSSTEDSAYSYTFAASDTVKYTATSRPSWLAFDAGKGVLSGIPTNSEVGTHSVVLTATDASGAVDAQSSTITGLALKTKCGLEGRIGKGRSAEGNAYGYDGVREYGPNGPIDRGRRTINTDQA